jgi:general stress protein 26
MNSINRNQPEENRADLSGPGAVAKIKELVGKAETCHFRSSGPHRSRPMNVRQVDDRGHLWFLAANDSHLVRELGSDPSIELYFQGSPHSDFLFVEGRATTSRNKAKIEELWEPVLKTWFTEGQDDPRITVIEVSPSGGYYWDTKHGGMVAGVKMLIGAATGVTLDDSIEGTLNV